MLMFLNGYYDPRNTAPLLRLPKQENEALLVKVVNKALGKEGEGSIVNASTARRKWRESQIFKALLFCICVVNPSDPSLSFLAKVRHMRTIGANITDAGNVSIDSSVPDMFHYLVAQVRLRQDEFRTLNFGNCWSEEPKKPASAKKEKKTPTKKKGPEDKDGGGEGDDRLGHVAFDQNCEILSDCLEQAFSNDHRFDRFVQTQTEKENNTRIAFGENHRKAVATNNSVIREPSKYPTDFGKGMAVVIEIMKICTGDIHCLDFVERFNHPFAPSYDQYAATDSEKSTNRCRNIKWIAGFILEAAHFICVRMNDIAHTEEAVIHTLRNGDDLLRNDKARKQKWPKEKLDASKAQWLIDMAALRAEFIDEHGNPRRATPEQGMVAGFVQVPQSIREVNSDFKAVGKKPSSWQCTFTTPFMNRVKSSLNQTIVSDMFESILLFGLNPRFIDELSEEDQTAYWSQTNRIPPPRGNAEEENEKDDGGDDTLPGPKRRHNTILRGYVR